MINRQMIENILIDLLAVSFILFVVIYFWSVFKYVFEFLAFVGLIIAFYWQYRYFEAEDKIKQQEREEGLR